MRTLLFHCKNYKIKIGKLSNRPKVILPEQISENEQACQNCIVALITVEDQDNPEKVSLRVANEILKMAQEIDRNIAVILPFAHLSNNLAHSKDCIQTFDLIIKHLNNKIKVIRSHFGSHKELLIDVYGHPGNARYREF